MSRSAFKGREAVIYLPSSEDLEIWKAEAEEHGTSLSKYIFEMAQRGRRSSPPSAMDHSDDRRSDLITEIDSLREKLSRQNLVLEKMKQSLTDLQSDNTYYYVPELIKMFRSNRVLTNDKIIYSLHLKPGDDELGTLFKTLTKLHEWLLIDANTQGGWKWIK